MAYACSIFGKNQMYGKFNMHIKNYNILNICGFYFIGFKIECKMIENSVFIFLDKSTYRTYLCSI